MSKVEITVDVFVLIMVVVLTLIFQPTGEDMTDFYLIIIIYFLGGIKRLEAMKLD